MANRLFNQFRLSLEKSVVDIFFKATIGASGAVTLDAAASKGVASITKGSDAGEYSIVLQDTYNSLLNADFIQILAAGVTAAPDAVIQTETVSSTKTIVVQFGAAGVAANMATGTVLKGCFSLSNSTAK